MHGCALQNLGASPPAGRYVFGMAVTPAGYVLMADSQRPIRLETEALIIGYAMSRLDDEYVRWRKLKSWSAAYDEVSRAMSVRALSFRNLRDEFDPFHSNKRVGWHNRTIHPSRQRVLEDLKDVSDEALKALVDRIIIRDEEATAEAVDSLAAVPRTAQNVAERLLTGRRAEEYFAENCEEITGIKESDLVDCRQLACGFDFAVMGIPELGIEVKGLKPMSGNILFTDREWSEAAFRRDNYWLVVVGNLNAEPRHKVVRDPHSTLEASCSYQVSITANWLSRISVAS